MRDIKSMGAAWSVLEWLVGFSSKSPNNNLTDGQSPDFSELTSSEVKSWAESFEQLMASRSGQRVFREFLRCEYSEENILFWLACEELKQERSPEKVEEKARMIYEDYVSILSPREVSLDSRVRENLKRNMMSPNQHTFDEAQLQIYTLMHRDSYSRFVNSPIYKELLRRTGAEPCINLSSI
jgi:regulator of G-protein signaling